MMFSDEYSAKSNHVNLQQESHRQKGFVLFLALVSLVVMSLAAVALIRSVDTNSQITGNLAFRQNATLSAAYGLEAVAQTIGSQPKGFEEANTASDGYYATCLNFDVAAANPCGGERLTQDAQWVPETTSQLADGLPGIVNGIDLYGNTVQYIVERMCNQPGPAARERCMMSAKKAAPPGRGDDPRTPEELAIDHPLYRITVRVAGPKNTISYVQAFFS